MKTVWIYVNTKKKVGDVDHLKVFAGTDAADRWFKKNDPEGVAFRYEVLKPGIELTFESRAPNEKKENRFERRVDSDFLPDDAGLLRVPPQRHSDRRHPRRSPFGMEGADRPLRCAQVSEVR